MQRIIQISTPSQNGLHDITSKVDVIVSESWVLKGMVNVHAQVATAAIII